MSHTPLLVLDVVGLTPQILAHAPNLAAAGKDGFTATLDPVLPALTCSMQATFLTGATPAQHGIVGNGWYFRDLGEAWLWRQSHALIEAETVWRTARRQRPDLRVANLCWWYAMGAETDWTLTPRPVYHADGRKSPDCYTQPAGWRDELTAALGPFPLFRYWGPGAGLESSAWIAAAAERLLARERPDLMLVYLPHLDYDLQRFGPDSPEAFRAAADIDEVACRLVGAARERGATVVVLSEYGIRAVCRPVDVNRALRRAGLLSVFAQRSMEYLDPHASAAFAVADHQIAHVYVRDHSRTPAVSAVLRSLPGVADVLDADGKRAAGLDHPRAGDLVALAEPDAWFTYYWWLDDDRAPDFARTVEIHRKPGYDPAELFLDPADRLVKLRLGLALARRAAGFRSTLSVVPLDPSCVRGSHGLIPDDPAEGPVFLCSEPGLARDRLTATDVRDVLLALLRR